MNRKVSYTYDDFKTSKPYEEMLLYLGKDNFISVVQSMQARAKEVGFDMDEFDERYEACKERYENNEDDEMNVTAFTNQPLELLCGKYECFGNIIKLGKKIICYTPIMPVKVYKDIDNDGDTMYEVAFLVKGKWKTRVFPCQYLIDNRNVVKLAGYDIDVSTDNARLLVKFFRIIIALNRDTFDEVKCSYYLGYADVKKYGFNEFIPFSDKVFYSKSCQIGMKGHYEIFDSIHECGDFKTWLNEACKCRKYSLEARLTLSASFASVVLERLHCQPFFVHLWSPLSGSGKSVALMLAISVWADPDLHGKYVQTAGGTIAANERTAGFFKNLPMCIDELQIASRKEDMKIDVYRLTEGKSSSKADKDSKLGIAENWSWHNCFITTGETEIVQNKKNVGAGALNRIFNIPCSCEHNILENAPKTADILMNNYGFAGKMFLKLLQDKEIYEELKECYDSHKIDLEKIGVSSKLVNSGAAIMATDYILSTYIFKDISKDGSDYLTPQKVGELLYKKDEISIGKRGYSFFCDWVTKNEARFDDIDNNGERNAVDKYGELRTVNNHYCACIIKDVFDEVCAANGFDSKALLRSLKNDKHLISNSDKEFTKSFKIKKITQRRIVLKLEEE